MSECKNCKYAVWEYLEFYPHARVCFVTDCKLGNDEEDDCKYFEETEEDDGDV